VVNVDCVYVSINLLDAGNGARQSALRKITQKMYRRRHKLVQLHITRSDSSVEKQTRVAETHGPLRPTWVKSLKKEFC